MNTVVRFLATMVLFTGLGMVAFAASELLPDAPSERAGAAPVPHARPAAAPVDDIALPSVATPVRRPADIAPAAALTPPQPTLPHVANRTDPAPLVPCAQDGVPGITVRGACVLVTATKLSLDRQHVHLLPAFKDHRALETIGLQGEIPTLDPLLHFPALTWVSLHAAQVGEASALHRLPGLRRFSANRTTLTELTFLDAMPRLERLTLRDSPIRDFAPLARHQGLTELRLSKLPGFHLSTLAGLSGLQVLDLDGLNDGDLSPLSGLRELRDLNLYDLPVQDLTPLAPLTQLQFLRIGAVPAGDIASLSGMVQMQSLKLVDMPALSDLTPLSNLRGLGRLDLSGSAVTDTSPVDALPYLRMRM